MDQKIKSLINQIKAHLIKMYGGKIKKVILYGSYLRDALFVKREANGNIECRTLNFEIHKS